MSETTNGGDRGAGEPTVNVRASATVEAVPDEAHVHFDLSAAERSAEGALDAVRERMAELDALLDEIGVDADDRTSTVRVGEQGERDGSKWLSKGYRAFASLSVVVRDAEAVGRLVNDACGKAADQARKKTDAYATALGARLGDIVRVAEPGARTMEPASYEAPMATAAAAPGGAAGPETKPVLALRPGTQDVHAAVEVIFRLASP